MILNESLQRRAVLGHEVLLAHVDDVVGLGAGDLVLGEVRVHLVAVEVGVVRLADGVVQAHHLHVLEHAGPEGD